MNSRPIHPKHLADVMAMSAPEIVEYSMKRFADSRELWGLYSDGWATSELDDETGTFPVWPHPDFAVAYAIDAWSEYQVRRIDLGEFVGVFLPNFEEEGTLVGIFPRIAEGSIPITAEQFRDFLNMELESFGESLDDL